MQAGNAGKDGKQVFFRTVFLMGILLSLFAEPKISQGHILNLTDGNTVTFAAMINDLRQAKIILIGETHDNPHHHQAQLQIIEALATSGTPVALGLEMFRAESQPHLDRWLAGELDHNRFMQIFAHFWDEASYYEEIFLAARNNGWPMFGLNLSRQVIKQVATEGFASLSEKQLSELPVTQCVVDEFYMRFIERAFGGHHQQGADFVNFCEAQLLWDTVMAKNLRAYLEKNPGAVVVVLAGSGHAWKHAIPNQLQKLGETSWRVVLPEVPGRIEAGNISVRDADYLLLGVNQGPLH